MTRRLITATLALVLVIPAMIHAHEGHVHKVMGTVSSLQGDHLEVKTTDGKTVTVTLDTKTTILRGTTKLGRDTLKAGERVSIDATEEKTVMTAQTIKLGTAPPAKAKK
jgi:hypothetical protein